MKRPYLVVLALLVAVVLAVAAVDRYAPPPEAADADEPAATVGEAEPVTAPASGGAWVCPVGDEREGTDLAVSVIGPGAVGEDPGRLELGSFANGALDLAEATWLFPGTATRPELDVGAQGAVVASWHDTPVAIQREWHLDGEEDLPPGVVAGPCVADSSDRWLVPGMSTAGGHEANLRLANPYETDATVAIRLVTPEGPEEPTVLQNLTVQARSTTEIEINEHLPERDDVAAEVHVISGRASVEGYQLVRQAIGDVDGASLLASAARPSSSWTVPWVAGGGDRMSWLWVLNPGDRPAPVQLTLHTEDGGVVPEGLAEVTIEPGQLRRVDLRGTFPDDVDSGAITVLSEGEPVVASGAVRLEADAAEDTGVAVQLGARPDRQWVLAGGDAAGRSEQLRLVNPGSEPALVDVVLWDGTEVDRPEELGGIEVAPGALVRVDLAEHLGDVDGWGAFVEASEGQIVAGRVGQGGAEARNLVAGPASSSAAWRATTAALTSRHEPGLTHRPGTDLGVEGVDPLD